MNVKCAFFTAASHAGKSTLQRQFQSRDVAVLDNDCEIMKRTFEILAPGRGYHRHINPLNYWKHLRDEFDFDRLYRLHHRDWFHRAGQPAGFVAVGWIYAFEEWRNLALRAFDQLRNVTLDCKLFVLDLSHDDFFKRYVSGIKERNGPSHSFFQMTPKKQRQQSDSHYDQFLNSHLAESKDFPTCRFSSDQELQNEVLEFLK